MILFCVYRYFGLKLYWLLLNVVYLFIYLFIYFYFFFVYWYQIIFLAWLHFGQHLLRFSCAHVSGAVFLFGALTFHLVHLRVSHAFLDGIFSLF